MKITEGAALAGLNNVLGFPAGSPQSIAEWDDGMLQMVLDISRHIRRARANLTTTGVFTTQWTHTHAAGETLASAINPYTAVPGVGAWPRNGVPSTHDVWLVAAGAQCDAVTGNFTSARISLNHDAGVGFDAGLVPVDVAGAGSAVTPGAGALSIYEYTQEVSMGALGTVLAEPDNKTLRRCVLPVRIARGATIRFTTRSTGAGASAYKIILLLGLFPAGFGQDVAL